ncbi:MAG: hypothetical protein KIT82_11985 [Bradyrhizobium sp.]|nr:hypothetical protein [Bradyrhizobium sp.]
MKNLVSAGILAAAAFAGFGMTLAPSRADAAVIYNGNGGFLWLDWLDMEACNRFTQGTVFVCMPTLVTSGGGGSSGGPVLQRANGEASLLVSGKAVPVRVATPASGKALQEIIRQGDPKKVDPAAFQKAVDAAFAGASRKVDDAAANGVAQQYKARIENQKLEDGKVKELAPGADKRAITR